MQEKFFYVGMHELAADFGASAATDYRKEVGNIASKRFTQYTFDNTAAAFLKDVATRAETLGLDRTQIHDLLCDVFREIGGKIVDGGLALGGFAVDKVDTKFFKLFCDILQYNYEEDARDLGRSGDEINFMLREWTDNYLYGRMQNMKGITNQVEKSVKIDECLVQNYRHEKAPSSFTATYPLENKGFIVKAHVDTDFLHWKGKISDDERRAAMPDIIKLADDTFNSFMVYRSWFLNGAVQFNFNKDIHIDHMKFEDGNIITVTVPLVRCIEVTDAMHLLDGIYVFEANDISFRFDSKLFRLTP
jgi:hypothetical protein